MKKTTLYRAGIALVLIAALATLGCDLFGLGGGSGSGNNNGSNNGGNNNGGNNTGGNNSGGLESLKFTDELVYEQEDSDEDPIAIGSVDYVIDDGGLGGTGSITAGKFSYEIGAPAADKLQAYDSNNPNQSVGELAEVYNNVKLTPSDTNIASLKLTANGYYDYYKLVKTNETMTWHGDPMGAMFGVGTVTADMDSVSVTYVYVDKDATLTMSGKNTPESMNMFIMSISMTLTTRNTTLKLKKGWNMIKATSKGKMTISGGQGNAPIAVTMTTGDSSDCKWMLEDPNGDSGGW